MMFKKLIILLFTFQVGNTILYSQNVNKIIYKFNIKDQIAPPVQRLTSNAIETAHELKVDIIFIEMNTYGGMVDAADSIRTRILRSRIPVYVLIQNNAASAGALIAIACDSIYMQAGSTIGAATVVDQSGQQVPDKYQSYMRKKMRSTAEIRGRNPDIAEAMVDPDIYVEGVSDTGKVVTLTTTEALKHGFCEAQLESLEDVMGRLGLTNYEVIEHEVSGTEKIISLLINPFVSGILVMIIIAGIYFELQTPGVGFPIIAAVTAAILYFAPLYLEGLATHFEIVLFILGIILLGIEIFVIPGFGIAGISGIILIISGLTLSLVYNDGFDFTWVDPAGIVRAFLVVSIASVLSIFLSIYFGGVLLYSAAFQKIVLNSEQKKEEGYTSAYLYSHTLIGKTGITLTMLRPSGKVEVDGEEYDATALSGFIDKGEKIKVLKYETAQLVVKKQI